MIHRNTCGDADADREEAFTQMRLLLREAAFQHEGRSGGDLHCLILDPPDARSCHIDEERQGGCPHGDSPVVPDEEGDAPTAEVTVVCTPRENEPCTVS